VGDLVSVDKNLIANVFPVDVWELVVDWPIAAAATCTFVVCHGGIVCCGDVANVWLFALDTAALHLSVADTTIVSAIELSRE
jgi:hypothetical protein